VIDLTNLAQRLILRTSPIFKIRMGLFLKINFSGLANVIDGPAISKITGESTGRVYVAANSPVIFACLRSYSLCGGLGQGGFARRSQPRVEELAEIASGNLLVHGLESWVVAVESL
jgi:hypothetical protein